MGIEALDLLYVPSRDIEADLAFYRDVLGARVVFAIEAMDTRVAEVAIGPGGPRLVLADHLGGDAPVLLHRVPTSTRRSLSSASAGCGWSGEWSCRSARVRHSEPRAASGSASTS